MKFSNEELYDQFGQYDTLIYLQFRSFSDSWHKFGSEIGGTIIYTQEERAGLEKLLASPQVPRTRKSIRLRVSEVYRLSQELVNELERFGLDCADINSVSYYNGPRSNRFTEERIKEIPIRPVALDLSDWSIHDGHSAGYGILDRRFKRSEPLAPFEVSKLLAFRQYRGLDNSQSPFRELLDGREDEVEYFYCSIEFERMQYDESLSEETIDKSLIDRYVKALIKRKATVDAELVRSGEQIITLIPKYKEKIENLYRVCLKFEGIVHYVKGRIVYLDFDRFLHIYARHVSETQIGENFQEKTMFQYKFDDIQRLIKVVINSLAYEISEHFRQTPEIPFYRKGSRSAYHDGHYYRIQIEPDGRLVDFHPYDKTSYSNKK